MLAAAKGTKEYDVIIQKLLEENYKHQANEAENEVENEKQSYN
jgi:hypothetical protein